MTTKNHNQATWSKAEREADRCRLLDCLAAEWLKRFSRAEIEHKLKKLEPMPRHDMIDRLNKAKEERKVANRANSSQPQRRPQTTTAGRTSRYRLKKTPPASK